MNPDDNIGILAVGNLLRRDEGVGLHVLELLKDVVPPNVELLDGGTSGMSLLSFIENKKHLIILDAVDDGRAPGEVVEWRGEEVPKYCKGKLSLHEMSFAEVLYWAHFTGNIPEEIVVVGIQPESLEWGTELSETAVQSLPQAIEKVVKCLKQWQDPRFVPSADGAR
ncbi:MAG: HyaD/HybD family hydrogenase maturation endopeptidase [Desulfitobacteriaceae bacterium]